MKFVWDSPLCVDSSSSPSSLAFWVQFSSFSVFCVRKRWTLEFVVWWTLCDDSNPSSQVLNLLESRVLTNWSFWVLEKTTILFDLHLISHDLLIFWERSFGNMFTGLMWSYPPSFIGFGLRLLEICRLKLCLRSVWVQPVWPVSETGLTGLGFWTPARPVWLVGESGQTGPSLPGLQIFLFASVVSLARSRGVLCWFSSSIAISNFT